MAARVNADKIYRWSWTDKDANVYRLDFIASDNESVIDITTATVVNLDPLSLDLAKYKRAWEDLPIGLEGTPTLELEIDVELTGTDFNTLLKDPFRDYETNWTLQNYVSFVTANVLNGFRYYYGSLYAGNMFLLYLNSQCVYAGFQKSGIEGQFKDGVLKVEVFHFSRIIMEMITLKETYNMNVLAKIDSASGDIKQSQIAYDVLFKKSDYAYMNIDDFAIGATPPADKYFYFIRKTIFFAHLNEIFKEIGYIVCRHVFSKADLNSQLPIYDNITYYKQNYTSNLGKGTALIESEQYFLGYIANLPISVDRTSVVILDAYYKKLEQYTNVWDFYVAYTKGNLVRGFCTVTGLDYLLANDGAEYGLLTTKDNDIPTPELESGVLDKSEAASIEKIESDIDKIEYIGGGSRSQNDNNLTVIFNTMPSVRKDVGGGTLGIAGTGMQQWFNDMFKTTDNAITFKARHFSPYFFKIYYFERPFVESVYMTTEDVAISANHNIKIDLGNTVTSDDFITEMTATFDFTVTPNLLYESLKGGLVTLQNTSGGALYHLAKCLSELFNGRVLSQIQIDSTFDVLNDVYEGSSVTVSVANSILVRKVSKFGYDISKVHSFLDTANTKSLLQELEMDLTCKRENGYEVINKIKMLSTNYA